MEENKDQAEEQSEATEQPQGSEDFERYNFLSRYDKEETKEEVKEEVKEEENKEADTPKVEPAKEEEKWSGWVYDTDTYEVKKGDKVEKLIRMDFDDGSFAYVPEAKKGGFLMQSDYTKKTTELSRERQEVEQKKQYIDQLQFLEEIGRPRLEPFYDSLSDENGEVKKDKEGNVVGIVYNDFDSFVQAKKDFSQYHDNYLKLKQTNEQVRQANLKMLEGFKNKYGDETFNKVIQEANKYMNPYVFKELTAYPEDALEIIRKGLMYDEDLKKKDSEIEQKVNEEVLKKLKETSDKQGKTITTPKSETPETDTRDIPSRYGFMNKK